MKENVNVVVINYGIGNVGSIANMFKKIGYNATITNEMEALQAATHLILPGVGSFDHGMKALNETINLADLKRLVFEQHKPILGICLGMQMLLQMSEEGMESGLGFISGKVSHFDKKIIGTDKTIPHMGWNYIKVNPECLLFSELPQRSRFYFVHSYFAQVVAEYTAATTSYGPDFCSAIFSKNIVGVQFHPEKSHKYGMAVLRNFVENY